MPKSRNRKNKNKEAFTNHKKKSVVFSLIASNDCRTCEGARVQTSFGEIPKEDQAYWVETELIIDIDYFLYCPDCKEYSAISKPIWN